MDIRGFRKVNEKIEVIMPQRQTSKSAGYDFYILQDVVISPKQTILLPTNVKAYMQDDEVLMLFIRSSLAIKKGLLLQNSTGIIDADFYPNEIKISLVNTSEIPITLKKDERVVQGLFMKYLQADQGNLNATRQGGIGSTKE